MPLTHEQAPKWKGKYPVTDTTHFDDLEMRAAINQHHFRMAPHEAEEKAHKDYRREQIVAAAAHHLAGMHAAFGVGHLDEAKKHSVMYALALHQLGHKDLVNPPDEVMDHMKKTPSKDIAHFKAHPADLFSMPTPTDNTTERKRGQLEPDVKKEAQAMREKQMTKAELDGVEYPEDHKLGMVVPKGGSSCSSCSYVSSDLKKCGNESFQKWNGGDTLPAPADEYCCDLYKIGGTK